ncbi:hypothetical protein [Chitinophaga pinensis]|uniref:Uncharacterized protein n=1 Tax=Chitinophaga pinensis (strain ATCC 43595 / DSM 2588 / LMG 13176 / NBRC 15968 / NCIMB 11800 / UQM 2034) TaxID=485918 RepID=A0A979GY14_CHIPD|nr:hypothetical protein [Chitinophaga pinensis]ACU61565.1 hypothetical protein Cpin_4105 [Chitinophaga pinensis DSM 2588]
MKERKFHKQIAGIVQDKFQELDVSFARLLITFRQLYDNIVSHDSRIRKIESAAQAIRTDQTTLQSNLITMVLSNHKLKRQLKHANVRADFIYSKTVEFGNELVELKNELIALKGANMAPTDNSEEKKDPAAENAVKEAAA